MLPKQEDRDPDEEIKSLITMRQAQVLRLRSQGCSQQQVAEIMGTTRANVSKLEQRANQNIMIARKTIHDWVKIQAPISSFVPAGTDVPSVPAILFRAADLKGIHLPVNSIDLIVQLKTRAPILFDRQTLLRDVEIFITPEGQILLISESAEFLFLSRN